MDNVRPWFWVLWLFLGPLAETVATHQYNYFNTMVRVRIEAVITQLVFDHSMRIRLKAEASEDGTSVTPAGSKADSFVTNEGEEDTTLGGDQATRDESESATHQGSAIAGSSRAPSDSAKGKARADDTARAKKGHHGDSANLLGKINNFVTSDLSNILEGSDFLNFGMFRSYASWSRWCRCFIINENF